MIKNKAIIEYLIDYLDFLEIEKGLSSKTQENYARFLNKFFNWLNNNDLDKLSPDRLTPKHIWKYKVFLSRHIDPKSKQTLKKSTQNYYLIALRSLLEFFVERGINSLSPTVVKLIKNKSQNQVKFLTLKQLEELLNAPNSDDIIGLRDRAILEVLFSTGLRVKELTSLNAESIRLPQTAKEIELSIKGKGEKVRTVYFSARAVKHLKRYLGKRSDIDEAMFINYKHGHEKNDQSRRLSIKSIENIVKKYTHIAGLPVDASPHTLRHSFATDLLAQGANIRLVQEFLGHQNIATTQIYTHVTNEQLRDVHKKLHGGKRLK
ncbi:MAG: tyrosine-type recombinase/integrase [Patescibacteria group bacterium]|nr:tyrosine-type recombinase/integrase [Patescibacteria group bacterium]